MIPQLTQIIIKSMTMMTVKDNDSTIVQHMKNATRLDMAKRYSEPQKTDFLLESSAMDPRFSSLPGEREEKKEHLHFHCTESWCFTPGYYYTV